METKNLVQAALLIALAIVLQSIRLFVPLPPLAGTLLIGFLVNMMLVVTSMKAGLRAAVVLVCLLPVTAYFQGQLLLPFLIPIVILGNLCYVYALKLLKDKGLVYFLPAIAKTLCMVACLKLALILFNITGPIADTMMFAMSAPQLITGVIGVILGKKLLSFLKV